jgi:hypothetical protein
VYVSTCHGLGCLLANDTRSLVLPVRSWNEILRSYANLPPDFFLVSVLPHPSVPAFFRGKEIQLVASNAVHMGEIDC